MTTAADRAVSQSDASGVQRVRGNVVLLASLQSLPVTPSEFSTRTRVVMALRRIEFLRVMPSTAKEPGPNFDIHVFYKPQQHHIPLITNYTNGRRFSRQRESWSPSISSRSDPDTVVHRSLADLAKLHDHLFQLARTGHGLEPCAFCLAVITYCGYSRVKPHRSMTWLHSSESVAEKLSLYLTEVLDVVCNVRAMHTDRCAGQESIPLVLHRFLQPMTPRMNRSTIG